MKTTVEINDALLEEAKRWAERERTTLRALIEEGLRRLISERRRAKGYSLRRVTFTGEGVSPDVTGWEETRRRAYDGRGA
jgi:hypothetical protein